MAPGGALQFASTLQPGGGLASQHSQRRLGIGDDGADDFSHHCVSAGLRPTAGEPEPSVSSLPKGRR